MRRNSYCNCGYKKFSNVVFNWAWDQLNIEKFIKENYNKIDPLQYVYFLDAAVGNTFLRNFPEIAVQFYEAVKQNPVAKNLDLTKELEIEVGREVKSLGFFTEEIKQKILENRKRLKKTAKIINA